MIDSTWHPVRNTHAIEWWYFLLLTDDGEIYNGKLWVKGDYRKGLRAGSDLYGYPHTDKPWERHERFDHDAFYAERDKVVVRVEASLLEILPDELRLRIITDDCTLSGTAHSLLDCKELVIRHPINRIHGFIWTIPMLKGRFCGSLKTKQQETKPITGTLFVDHVLADIAPTFDMLKNYRGWCWGLVYCKDITCLFLQVDFKRAPLYHTTIDDNGILTRISSQQPLGTVRYLRGEPPGFEVNLRGQSSSVHLTRLFRLDQTTERGKTLDRLISGVTGIAKYHGAGTVNDGIFYFENLTMKRLLR